MKNVGISGRGVERGASAPPDQRGVKNPNSKAISTPEIRARRRANGRVGSVQPVNDSNRQPLDFNLSEATQPKEVFKEPEVNTGAAHPPGGPWDSWRGKGNPWGFEPQAKMPEPGSGGGKPPNEPPPIDPFSKEAPNPQDPLNVWMELSLVQPKPEEREATTARLDTGVEGLLDRYADFIDTDDYSDGRVVEHLELSSSRNDIRKLGVVVRQTHQYGAVKPQLNISFFSAEPSETLSLIANTYENRIVEGEERTQKHRSKFLPRNIPEGSVPTRLQDDMDLEFSNSPESTKRVEAGYPEVDFSLALAERESMRPIPFGLHSLDEIHCNRAANQKTEVDLGLEVGTMSVTSEDSQNGADEFNTYMSRFLKKHGYEGIPLTGKSGGEVASGDKNTRSYSIFRTEQGYPQVIIDNIEPVGDGIENFHVKLTYGINNKGEFVNTREVKFIKIETREVFEDPTNNPTTTVLADKKEARGLRNCLYDFH